MANRFGDPGGFIYNPAGAAANSTNILLYWSSSAGIGNWSVVAAGGRRGGTSLHMVGSAGDVRLSKSLDAQATWGIAFAFKASALPTGGTCTIAMFVDGTSTQVDLRLNGDGTLTVTRNGTSLGSSSFALAAARYYHIEWKCLIHGSTGTVEVRVNGTAVIGPLTGQNTQATGNASANVVAIGDKTTNSNGTNFDYDDLVIWDGQANDANGIADINNWIGDCGVYWILPTGAGFSTQFTPDSGSNYARVNEATPDGDTSYVGDSTVGHIDLYAHAALPAGVTTIKSLALVHDAKKTDTGGRSFVAEVRDGAASYAHATANALGLSYQYWYSVWGQSPDAGAAWTATSVNSLGIGQKVSA